MSEITSRQVEARSKAHQVSDWDRHRSLIIKLYGEKTLKEVVRILADQYGFHATERQYKQRLKAWDLRKYTSMTVPSPSATFFVNQGPAAHHSDDDASDVLSLAQDPKTTGPFQRQDLQPRGCPKTYKDNGVSWNEALLPEKAVPSLKIQQDSLSHARNSRPNEFEKQAMVEAHLSRPGSWDFPLPTSPSLNHSSTTTTYLESEEWRESGSKRRKGSHMIPRSSSRETKNLACPFHKHDPLHYSLMNSSLELAKRYRTCAGPGWDSISRLRQHISRAHVVPVTCPSCGEGFHFRHDLRHHAEGHCPSGLTPQLPLYFEGIPKVEMQQLKPMRAGLEVQASWWALYRMLFPSDIPVPSPYCQTSTGRSLGAHFDWLPSGECTSLSEHLHSTLAEKVVEGAQKQPLPQARAGSEAFNSLDRIESGEPHITISSRDLKSLVSDAVAETCAEWRQKHGEQKDVIPEDVGQIIKRDGSVGEWVDLHADSTIFQKQGSRPFRTSHGQESRKQLSPSAGAMQANHTSFRLDPAQEISLSSCSQREQSLFSPFLSDDVRLNSGSLLWDVVDTSAYPWHVWSTFPEENEPFTPWGWTKAALTPNPLDSSTSLPQPASQD